MLKKNILKIIKDSNLGGRGGADFPVYLKWQSVKKNLLKKKKTKAYLIINAAEGEPNLIKDGYILANDFSNILQGLLLSLDYFDENRVEKIYCFIRLDYYNKNKKKFKRILNKPEFKRLFNKFNFFIKPDKHDYLAGEESTLLNIIENKGSKPRLKPPFPGEVGLFSCPTLIHNVETWQALGEIRQGDYKQERLFYISGKVKFPGLIKAHENIKAKDLLISNKNWPKFRFFAQIGGDACGELVLDRQLDRLIIGSGSITIYPLKAKVVKLVLARLLKFHSEQSCGQCVPCREGSYRLLEMFNNESFKEKDLTDIIFALKYTSFCAFGSSLANLLNNYFVNIHPEVYKKISIKIE